MADRVALACGHVWGTRQMPPCRLLSWSRSSPAGGSPPTGRRRIVSPRDPSGARGSLSSGLQHIRPRARAGGPRSPSALARRSSSRPRSPPRAAPGRPSASGCRRGSRRRPAARARASSASADELDQLDVARALDVARLVLIGLAHVDQLQGRDPPRATRRRARGRGPMLGLSSATLIVSVASVDPRSGGRAAQH